MVRKSPTKQAASTVDCPTCGSVAGAKCVTRTMQPSDAPHIERSRAAIAKNKVKIHLVGESAEFTPPVSFPDDSASVSRKVTATIEEDD